MQTEADFLAARTDVLRDALLRYAQITIGRDRRLAIQMANEVDIFAHAQDMFGALCQIERLSREADRAAVDVPAMLGDIARRATTPA